MLEQLDRLHHADIAQVAMAKYVNATFLLEVGDEQALITIREGAVQSIVPGPILMPACDFVLRADPVIWEQYWDPSPQPGSNDLFALFKRKALRVEGNVHQFMSNLLYFKALMGSVRQVPAA